MTIFSRGNSFFSNLSPHFFSDDRLLFLVVSEQVCGRLAWYKAFDIAEIKRDASHCSLFQVYPKDMAWEISTEYIAWTFRFYSMRSEELRSRYFFLVEFLPQLALGIEEAWEVRRGRTPEEFPDLQTSWGFSERITVLREASKWLCVFRSVVVSPMG